MSLGVRPDYSGLYEKDGLKSKFLAKFRPTLFFLWSSVWYSFFANHGMRNPSCLGRVFKPFFSPRILICVLLVDMVLMV